VELKFNQLLRVLGTVEQGSVSEGIYRIILDEQGIGKVVAVLLDRPVMAHGRPPGRPRRPDSRRRPRKATEPMVGELLWLDRDELKQLHRLHLAHEVTLERDPNVLTPIAKESHEVIFKHRVEALALFLDFKRLEEVILTKQNTAGLVEAVVQSANVSEAFVRRQWSNLCRYGIEELSLRPRFDRCGAPGKRRPVAEGIRKKAGRKDEAQRLAADFGVHTESAQPGMSEKWLDMIIQAERAIKSPTLSLRQRHEQILKHQFFRRFKCVDGVFVEVEQERGTYPTFSQYSWCVKQRSFLERQYLKTTQANFDRNLKGARARSWQKVPGPGHTWTIDSTVGDIYLRANFDRSWILGRPIVYIIVDVWSTAVVGFYVSLEGPSWATASVALFNAAAPFELVSRLNGCLAPQTLFPAPTLPYELFFDRGEIHSRAARKALCKIIDHLATAAPYLARMKGIVESLHRISRDDFYPFTPGAMNFRRKEYELRHQGVATSAMTIGEFTQTLAECFFRYNLTSDRTDRLDPHMIAAGVDPSPAGLWRYGHMVGNGFSRSTSLSTLVNELLPDGTARVRRSGVFHARKQYESAVIDQLGWVDRARTNGGFDLPIRYHPGSVRSIWTPHPVDKGYLELSLSDCSTASHEQRFDEVADAYAFDQCVNKAEREHTRLMQRLRSRARDQQRTDAANAAARTADAGATTKRPSMTEARKIDLHGVPRKRTRAAQSTDASAAQASEDINFDLLSGVLAEMDQHED
jgi:putative transposase